MNNAYSASSGGSTYQREQLSRRICPVRVSRQPLSMDMCIIVFLTCLSERKHEDGTCKERLHDTRIIDFEA